jgi:hypothetical protein
MNNISKQILIKITQIAFIILVYPIFMIKNMKKHYNFLRAHQKSGNKAVKLIQVHMLVLMVA